MNNIYTAPSEIQRETAILSTHPDALRQKVAEVKQQHAHLHPPQIATLLQVPEACLVACEIDTDTERQSVYRLRCEPIAILSPMHEWGRMLSVYSNASGVFMPLRDLAMRSTPEGDVILTGDGVRASVNVSVIRECFFVIQHDELHGETRSVHFYDTCGDPVLKLYLFNHEKLTAVKKHMLSFKSDDQARTSTFRELKQRETAGKSSESHSITDLSRTCFQSGNYVQMTFYTAHGNVAWQGKMNKVKFDNDMTHIQSSSLRAHLRLNAVTDWSRQQDEYISASNRSGLLFTLKHQGDKT